MKDYLKELEKGDWGVDLLFYLILAFPFLCIYWMYQICTTSVEEKQVNNKNKKRKYK
tara:strand:+ start:249 stop:419 length:171 start_codon:yes stop_codon:yes gene_type:complete